MSAGRSAEGPLRKKIVVSKALRRDLKPSVVINKVDRSDARPNEVINEVFVFSQPSMPEGAARFPILYGPPSRAGWRRRLGFARRGIAADVRYDPQPRSSLRWGGRPVAESAPFGS